MSFLRQRFEEIIPYHSAYLTEGTILNANESPYAVPEALIQHMEAAMRELLVQRYPDTDCTSLRMAISKVYGVQIQEVVCGVGSDEILDCILASSLEPEDQVLIPYPSFSMYHQLTKLNSGQVIKVSLTSDFKYDVAAIKEQIIQYQPKVIFLCNPNNPTGSILTPLEIKELLDVAQGLVVVDEAYEDFASETLSVIPWTQKYNNLIVLRTFSKAYALAGARVGYGIACTEIIEQINHVKMPYNLNLFSQTAATWAMEHSELFVANAKKIMEEREHLEEGLRELGICYYPSEANFIFMKLPVGTFEALSEKCIYIRKMMVDEVPYYRVTIGTPEENQILLQALKEMK